MSLSSYDNLSQLLNYRTSNLGITTLTDDLLVDKNIFSYISNTGLTINPNISDINLISNETTTEDKENIIMKTLVFNNNILNNDDISKSACSYIINNVDKYNIGDFSDNITLNALFYEDNFVKHNDVDKDTMCSTLPTTNCDNIIDIDLSYYASQNVIKSMFLLDILIQLYHNISLNKDNREGIINNLRNLTIRSRYYVENEKWKVYNIKEVANVSTSYYNITFTDKLFPQERDATSGKLIDNQVSVVEVANVSFVDKSLKSVITIQSVSSMISLFNKVILKHINYIKIGDMMYADNYSNFYKLCRVMLNSVILNSVSLAVNNSDSQNTGSIDYIFNTGDIFKSLSITNNGNTIVKNNDSTTENDINNIISLDKTTDNSKIVLATYKKGDMILRPFAINIANIISSTPSTPSTPSTQTNNKLTLTITDNKLSKIENLEKGKIYEFYLYNFSSTDNDNLSINTNQITISWIDSKKKLEITAIDITGSYDIVSQFDLYMITANENSVTISTSLKTAIGSRKISVYFKGLTTEPEFKYNAPITETLTNVSTGITSTIIRESDITNPVGVICSFDMSVIDPLRYTITTPVQTINTTYFYTNTPFIPNYTSYYVLKDSDVFYYIWKYNSNPVNNANKYINEYSIVTTTNKPVITPKSYETSDVLTQQSTLSGITKYYGLNNTENVLITKILDNLSNKIVGNFVQDTKDNDEIVTSMYHLSDINKNLAKNSNIIKKNSSENTLETSKVLSSGILLIACIIILVVSVFATIYLPISNISRENAISISGVIFVIAIVMYIIMKILEKGKYNSYEESFMNYESYTGKINAIIKALLANLYNERTRISQQVVKPSIKKEEYYFSEKNKKFEIYKGRTYSDLQITSRIRKKNIAKIDCMLEISIVISLALLLYTLRPSWGNFILGISIVLIIISIFIMFVRLANIVQTNAKNKYWTRPDTSLEKLKFSTTALN
jgi:hypothetical protein